MMLGKETIDPTLAKGAGFDESALENVSGAGTNYIRIFHIFAHFS